MIASMYPMVTAMKRMICGNVAFNFHFIIFIIEEPDIIKAIEKIITVRAL